MLATATSAAVPFVRQRKGGNIVDGSRRRWRLLPFAAGLATRGQQQKQQPPLLVLSSPTKPESRYLYDIVDHDQIRLNREVHLPQMANNVCIGSSQGFLLSIPTCPSPEILAVNPLTGAHLSIPSTASLRSVPGSNRCVEKRKTWKRPEEEEDDSVVSVDENYYHLYKSRAILSPSLDTIVLLRREAFCVDFTRLDGGGGGGGSTSTSWSPALGIRYACSDIYYPIWDLLALDDCIFHKGKLYVTDYAGWHYVIDFDGPAPIPFSEYSSSQFKVAERDDGRVFWSSLVESPDGNDLFLVTRRAEDDDNDQDRDMVDFNLSKTSFFEVGKLNEGGEWDDAELGDLSLFVGPNGSFSFSARDFPNLKPNSVYFNDLSFSPSGSHWRHRGLQFGRW